MGKGDVQIDNYRMELVCFFNTGYLIGHNVDHLLCTNMPW